MSRYLDLGNPLNRDHPICVGLAGFWLPLPNNQGGTLLHDLTGQNHAPWTDGSPRWCGASRPPRLAPLFDGASGIGGSWSGALPYTFAAGFRPDAVGSDMALVGLGNGSGGRYRLRVDAAGTVSVGLSTALATTANSVTVGQWHFAAGIAASNTNRSVFLDSGALATNATNSGTTPGQYRIGRAGATIAEFFTGAIDFAAIYTRALGESEARWLGSQWRQGFPELLRWCTGRVTVAMPAAGGSVVGKGLTRSLKLSRLALVG